MENKVCSKCGDPESKEDHIGSCPLQCKLCDNKFFYANHIHCPACNSAPNRHELRNYDMMWHDGDVYCLDCDSYVRMWDAG